MKDKKELPKTWEELKVVEGFFINTSSEIKEYFSPTKDHCKNTWPTKELAEAALALSELLQYRDHYNRNPMAGSYHKYCTSIYKDEVGDVVLEEVCSRGPLTFHFKCTGLEFWDNFRELIETAKPLL